VLAPTVFSASARQIASIEVVGWGVVEFDVTLPGSAPGAHTLTLAFDGLRSPCERGLGEDRRRLGINLQSIRVERAS
jgi:hypothetical protein